VHPTCFPTAERATLVFTVDASITDLHAALEAERDAARQLRRARAHLGALIDRAVATGVPYGDIARVAVRLRLGRAPTVEERLREMDRLRQRRRRAVTDRHENLARPSRPRTRLPVGSSQEEPMSERLIKRTTIEEFFEEEPDGKECADKAETAAAEEEDEEEDDEEDEETD
jgi:hypothetical protein